MDVGPERKRVVRTSVDGDEEPAPAGGPERTVAHQEGLSVGPPESPWIHLRGTEGSQFRVDSNREARRVAASGAGIVDTPERRKGRCTLILQVEYQIGG